MSTEPTIHDSDRKAAEAMIAWLKEDHFQIDEKEFAEKMTEIIARHHAEERAAVEKVKQLIEDTATYFSERNLGEPARILFGRLVVAKAALTALRTASQSPTEGPR